MNRRMRQRRGVMWGSRTKVLCMYLSTSEYQCAFHHWIIDIYIYHNRSSNILVGFLEWLKKQPQQSTSSLSIPGGTWTAPSRKPNKPKLSHASLILLLN